MPEKGKPRPFFSGRTGPPKIAESQAEEIPIRILIEDGEPNMREMMALHLSSLGYECKLAETPDHALETFRSGEKFDLLCCDLAKWPDEKWWYLTGRKTHIVAAIATYDSALIEKILKNSGFDFLLKPFTPELLTIVVRRGLERHRLLMENLFFRNWIGLASGVEIPRMFYKDHL